MLRPPRMARWPRFRPLSRDQGAGPAREGGALASNGPVPADGPPVLPRSASPRPARCGRARLVGPGRRCAATRPGAPCPVPQSPYPARRYGAWWMWRRPTKLDDRQNHFRDVDRPGRLAKVCHSVIITRAARAALLPPMLAARRRPASSTRAVYNRREELSYSWAVALNRTFV